MPKVYLGPKLSQVRHLLKLLEDSGIADYQLQDLFASGLLTALFQARNYHKRNAVLQALGLPRVQSRYQKMADVGLGNRTCPSVREMQDQGVTLGTSFEEFLEREIGTQSVWVAPERVSVYTCQKWSADACIDDLGRDISFGAAEACAVLFSLLRDQPYGKEGPLETGSGRTYLLARGREGMVTLRCNTHSKDGVCEGWYVGIEGPHEVQRPENRVIVPYVK